MCWFSWLLKGSVSEIPYMVFMCKTGSIYFTCIYIYIYTYIFIIYFLLCVMCVNKVSHLNSRHGEIRNLKVNCDWSLCIQLITLHTGEPKVRPHQVLLPTLHMQRQGREKATKLLLHLVKQKECSE